MKQCAICHKTHDLFSLVLEDEGQTYTRYVCGSCWDIIAGISKKMIQSALDDMKNALLAELQKETSYLTDAEYAECQEQTIKSQLGEV